MTTNGINHHKQTSEYMEVIEYYMRKITLESYRMEQLSKKESSDKEIRACKHRIRRYRQKIAVAKRGLAHCMNQKAIECSYLDAIPDDYYLALIDREGCAKGAIL